MLNRKINTFALSLLVMMVTSSCDNNGETEIIEAEQELQMDASASTVQLSVYSLDRAITEITSVSYWVTVVQDTYVSGTPQVLVSCLENNKPNKRVAVVILKTQRGDKVILTVTQNVKTDIGDTHDTASDQPPLAPAR